MISSFVNSQQNIHFFLSLLLHNKNLFNEMMKNATSFASFWKYIHWITQQEFQKSTNKMWIEPNSFFFPYIKANIVNSKRTTKQLHMILRVIFVPFARKRNWSLQIFSLYRRRNQLHFDISFKFWLFFYLIPCDFHYIYNVYYSNT